MFRFLKWLLSAVIVLLVAAFGYLRVSPPELLQVGTGYAAKMICSNVFIAGRDAQQVLRDDVQAPGHPILKLVSADADPSAGEVTTSLIGGIAPALAVHRTGLGCTLVPGGDRSLLAQLEPPSEPTPAYDWRETADSRLDTVLADDALTGPGMRAVVVVKNGAIVGERYGEGFTRDTPLLGWSMTKTVTAMIVGELVKQGALDLSKSSLFPEWAGDDRAKITLGDLLAMESGLKWNEGYGDVSDVTRMLFLTADMQGLPRSMAAEAAPDEAFVYSSGTSLLVSQLIEEAVGTGAQGYARMALFNPLGLARAVIEPDASGTLAGSSYMYATARDWARLGQFMIGGGVAAGQALLPAGFTQFMVTPTAASKGEYGQGHIWMADMDEGAETGLPKGSYRFSGHDGQSVVVVPSERLVVVRMGLTPSRLGYQPYPLVQAVMKALGA
jgi:CubicO group peptidase (beta-lactamase class C family)